MAFGDFVYTPPVNQTVVVECGGGSGKGGLGQWATATTVRGGASGAGGGYARKHGINLTGSVDYHIHVAAPSQIVDSHITSFEVNVVRATNGSSASGFTHGVGGQGTNGDVLFDGSDGQDYTGDLTQPTVAGRGGGGGAGAGGDGQAGSGPVGGAGGAPDGTYGAGGAGGDGVDSAVGNPGEVPAGGGAGGGAFIGMPPPFQSEGGDGIEGWVRIWLDTGVWPPVSPATLLAEYGSPPALPVSNKARKSSFIIG